MVNVPLASPSQIAAWSAALRGGGEHTQRAPSWPGRSRSASVSSRYCGQVSA